jgi:hypothetical protein
MCPGSPHDTRTPRTMPPCAPLQGDARDKCASAHLCCTHCIIDRPAFRTAKPHARVCGPSACCVSEKPPPPILASPVVAHAGFEGAAALPVFLSASSAAMPAAAAGGTQRISATVETYCGIYSDGPTRMGLVGEGWRGRRANEGNEGAAEGVRESGGRGTEGRECMGGEGEAMRSEERVIHRQPRPAWVGGLGPPPRKRRRGFVAPMSGGGRQRARREGTQEGVL